MLWPEDAASLDAERQREIVARTLLKRPGSPEDVARAVRFFATDALLLELLAAARRGAPPVRAWRAALLRAGVPAGFRTVAGFLSSPFARVADAPPDGAQQARLARALHPLIWDWKGALHREWYPYLFMLAADLRLAGGGARARESGWLRKTYGPLLAGQLLTQTEATRRGRGPRRQVGDDGEDTVTSWPWVAPA